jgi:zinc transporter ZupT
MNAMATGSILYIVFFEILTKERHTPYLSGHLQLLGILLGFAVIISLQLLTSHQY